MAPENLFACGLRYGIQLVIWNESGQLTLRDVSDFLANAVNFYKHQRDSLKVTTYTEGPYGHTVASGRRILGEFQLSCPNDTLTAAQWTEAVIDAYSRTTSLEEMRANVFSSQQRAGDESPSDFVAKLHGLLRQPGGHFLALASMLSGEVSDQSPGTPGSIHSHDFTTTRIRTFNGEPYVSVGPVYCLISNELFCNFMRYVRGSGNPVRIHGIACDATFFVFGSIPQYRAFDIHAESRDLAKRLLRFFPSLPRNTDPYPVIVNLTSDGQFAVSVSKAKRVRHG